MTKIESEHIFVQKISCAKSVAAKIQWEYRPQVHFEKTAFAMLQECFMKVWAGFNFKHVQ